MQSLDVSTCRNTHLHKLLCPFLESKAVLMATRSAVARIPRPAWPAAAAAAAISRRMEGMRGGRMPRYFSDGQGRVLGEEERAAENVYIQKMEREKLEKMRRKADKAKAEAAKAAREKKAEELQKS